ncbi:hypothetical protein [Tropicimonas sediminicola]|uniref:Uncharacterized protein n=1 Tax=Tropicimonas sediminicola TaxID=1031541 RepID=A0A239CJE4_9RHOB|nr:hypothetical protein [Tropicimonas sediminicola]SNS20295.1 hypothetical protein SAMN05421757_101328 [Tropicimonas sediminicola]
MNRWGLGLSGALFYAAPIGAGATGASYFAVLPFAGLFLLWVLIMRVEPFREGLVMLVPTLMVHLALASLCIGFGHMLRALLGIEATTGLLPWLVMGLGALALGRVIWQPRKEAEAEAFAEAALKKLNEFADEAEEILDREPDLPLSHPTGAEAAALAVAYGAIDAMPADAPEEAALSAVVMPLEAEVRAPILLEAFLNRAERTGTRRDRHAALLLAADGGLAWRQLGEGRMAQAFDQIVASADTVTLAHFLRLANTLLDGFPTTRNDLPEVSRLLDIAAQIEPGHPELSDALVHLANRIEDIDRDLNTND